jgi:hypothetical protein
MLRLIQTSATFIRHIANQSSGKRFGVNGTPLLLDNAEISTGQLIFYGEQDFPESFHRMAHPDDYKLADEPLKPEYMISTRRHHLRLLFR